MENKALIITFLKKYIQLVYTKGFKFLFTFVLLHQRNNILGERRRVCITAAIVKKEIHITLEQDFLLKPDNLSVTIRVGRTQSFMKAAKCR